MNLAFVLLTSTSRSSAGVSFFWGAAFTGFRGAGAGICSCARAQVVNERTAIETRIRFMGRGS